MSDVLSAADVEERVGAVKWALRPGCTAVKIGARAERCGVCHWCRADEAVAALAWSHEQLRGQHEKDQRDIRTAMGAAERFRAQGIKDSKRAEAAEGEAEQLRGERDGAFELAARQRAEVGAATDVTDATHAAQREAKRRAWDEAHAIGYREGANTEHERMIIKLSEAVEAKNIAEAAARAGGCAADALGRLVADLETNSERGAPDYAHDALVAHDRAVSGQTAEADKT